MWGVSCLCMFEMCVRGGMECYLAVFCGVVGGLGL